MKRRLTIAALAGCMLLSNRPVHSQSLAQNGPAGVVKWWLTTSDQSALLKQQPDLEVKPDGLSTAAAPGIPIIGIDPAHIYQAIDGFGFALTGGSAQHIYHMSPASRSRLLQDLFSTKDEGIGISYLRISIGSSDLNDHTFSYDDLPAGQTDTGLEKFSLREDQRELIPVLREILAINPAIKILGSPWSAPIWMKTNRNIQGGKLKEEYYGVYASYLERFVTEMSKEGIPIDAITVQNEPFNDGNTPSMQMFAKEQARFIRDFLGPKFQAAAIRTKIILYDHNCDAPEYPISILSDSAANPYIDGSGFHLYAGNITALSKVHDYFPNKNLYFTEMMAVNHGADFNIAGPVDRILIGAMRNWSRNVILWNLAADPFFRPHTDNGGCSMCQGAITVDTDRVTRNIAYYVIGHASRFVPQGSQRIESSLPDGISNVAFITPDKKIALIVANRKKTAQTFRVSYAGQSFTARLEPGAVATFTW